MHGIIARAGLFSGSALRSFCRCFSPTLGVSPSRNARFDCGGESFQECLTLAKRAGRHHINLWLSPFSQASQLICDFEQPLEPSFVVGRCGAVSRAAQILAVFFGHSSYFSPQLFDTLGDQSRHRKHPFTHFPIGCLRRLELLNLGCNRAYLAQCFLDSAAFLF